MLQTANRSGIMVTSRHMCDQAADLNSQSAIGATHAPFSRPQFMAGVMSALRSTELWLGLQLHDTCHPLPEVALSHRTPAMTELTIERARELFSYDENTGILKRKNLTRGVNSSLISGSKTDQGYLRTFVDGISYKNHRLIWFIYYGLWPSDNIDHIDGDGCNNRISNLRVATQAKNIQNLRKSHKDSVTGYLGTTFDKSRGLYMALIRAHGRNVYLGRFKTPEEAHHAYLNAKRQLHAGCTI